MQRLILHVDLDAFFAAIEQRDRPEWRGRPLVVGARPGGRGVVATCSYEARVYGVRSAMPIGEAVRRLPPETIYLRPDMARYAQVSSTLMQALTAVSPVIEPVSIDEAYLDVSGLERLIGSPQQIAGRVKALIRESVGLTASVGIGPNRLIAKLASEAGKPDGLEVVPRDAVSAFLDPMPLGVLRGLGAKSAPRLSALGVRTLGEVRRLPLATLRQALGARQGTAVFLQAQGKADDQVVVDRARHSISKETTFPSDQTDPVILRDTLRWAAAEVGYLARHGGHQGRTITLKIRFRGFETHTRSRSLPNPTADDRLLYQTARQLLESSGWLGRPVRLIGLGLSGWPVQHPQQPDLFDKVPPLPAAEPTQRIADERLAATLDAIRDRFGPGIIRRGSARAPRK